jgi:hypothetical protein
MDSASVIVGCLIGAVLVGVLYTLFESDNGWTKQFKIKRLKPKVGDMFATYHQYYVEDWMQEDYNELFQVKYVGKKYVRLESIEDRRSSSGNNSTGRTVDVEILQLNSKYLKYGGTKNKKTMYNELLDD